MNRLAWAIARSPLGWPGVAAIAIAAVASMGQALLVPAMQARLEALSNPRPRGHVATSPASQLERFYGHFREAGTAPGQLAKLHRIATANGIVLRQGEYRLVAGGEGRLSSYQVTLPVSGAYPAVRKFLAQSLDELPTVALDQVTFERRRIGEAGVDAQVRLTFFLEKP